MDMRKTIRKEIETCGKSRNQIAIDTGIEPAVLCRLMQGGSIKAETAETLLKYFNYRLIKGNRK